MTISANTLGVGGPVNNRPPFAADLLSTSSEALVIPGTSIEIVDREFGVRKFKYVRFDNAVSAGELQSFVTATSIGSITAGSTTTITTSGLTADKLVGGIVTITDDAGGAGAAPEGESARIIANTATLVTVDSNDAFSAAVAASDTATYMIPWAVVDSADGHAAYKVAGVAMVDHVQYNYGWVQFKGIHTRVKAKASTAIVLGESVVADAAQITDGAGDGAYLHVGVCMAALASDSVARTAVINLNCGEAAVLATSAA